MTRRGGVLIGLGVLVALLGAGCDGGSGTEPDRAPGATSTSPARPSASAAPPSASPSRTPDVVQPTDPGAVLVRYKEEGGIDGRIDVLTVFVDGRYVVESGRGTRKGRLGAADAERLREALAAVRFDEIDATDMGMPYTGPDQLNTTVQYQDRFVVLGEGWDIPGMPAVLDALPPLRP
ncbi:hypothetical protein AB0M28_37570 [Streptomyces sp. NPDC051940]|uniref:hypothetical protein n=1 Tax=Streptomyces sp. NPDC051940 TaxID=3155675 RepID=UPI00343EA171